MKKGLTNFMENIVPQNIAQCQFDFDSLSLQPVPDLAEVGITITPLPETQEYWWSELEYRNIPDSPGIYAIVNMLNGHFYVGSAVNLAQRKRQHFKGLKADKHENRHLQHAYNRYGADAFFFCIIENIEYVENLLEREQHYIDTLNPEYNIARVAGSNLGMKQSEEHKAKISKALKGRPRPDEIKVKIGNAHKGKKISEEQRARLSEINKGKTHTEETRAKLSKANKGRKIGPFSEEHKANLSAAKKGKPSPKRGIPMSEEQKTKLSEAMKGRKLSQESIDKCQATKKARRESGEYTPFKHSEESKAKMSASLKGRTAHNKGKPMSEDQKAKLSKANKGKKASDETKAKLRAAQKARREREKQQL